MDAWLEFIWDGLFTIWRIFVILTVFSVIAVILGTIWNVIAYARKDRPDWRDDFR